MKSNCPNYHAIYADLIAFKKVKNNKADEMLNTFKFNSALDVIEFNKLLFSKENGENSKLKSYTLEDIKEILYIKKVQNLSIREISIKFRISKATLLKWHKLFEKTK